MGAHGVRKRRHKGTCWNCAISNARVYVHSCARVSVSACELAHGRDSVALNWPIAFAIRKRRSMRLACTHNSTRVEIRKMLSVIRFATRVYCTVVKGDLVVLSCALQSHLRLPRSWVRTRMDSSTTLQCYWLMYNVGHSHLLTQSVRWCDCPEQCGVGQIATGSTTH